MRDKQNQNRNSNAGRKDQGTDRTSTVSTQRSSTERSDRGQKDSQQQQAGDTSRSSSQGRKEASGGRIEE